MFYFLWRILSNPRISKSAVLVHFSHINRLFNAFAALKMHWLQVLTIVTAIFYIFLPIPVFPCRNPCFDTLLSPDPYIYCIFPSAGDYNPDFCKTPDKKTAPPKRSCPIMLFCIIFILRPSRRIIIYVFPYGPVIVFITNHMVIKPPLPDILTDLMIAITFEQGNEFRDDPVCSFGVSFQRNLLDAGGRRVRRLRRTEKSHPVIIIIRFCGVIAYGDDHMDMVRHDHIFINKYVIIFVIHQPDVLFYNLSSLGKPLLRYVASAVPYNSP